MTINNTKLQNLLKDVKNLPPEKKIKRTVNTEKNIIKTYNTRGKSKSLEILYYEIYEEDDDTVRLIKETVNEMHITMQDIYKEFDNNNSGYNLLYGLRVRHSLTYESLQKWAKILGFRIEIILVKDTSK